MATSTQSRPLRRRGLLVAAAVLALVLVSVLAWIGPGDDRPFAPDSFWNEPLGDDAPLDPRSDAYVAELNRQVEATGAWINTNRYSTPVYEVGEDHPTVPVALDVTEPDLQAAFDAVPIPSDAQPAEGTDAHMVIWQPSTDKMWEFWRIRREDGTWRARWGGFMSDVSENPGRFESPNPDWGATATSLPLLGGLIRIEELREGRIDHALALAIPDPRAGVWSWPAQRTDGSSTSPDAIPEGTRFRLPPELDLDALDLPPPTRAIAEAAQRHGLVIRDVAGVVTFFAEAPTSEPNPYTRPGGIYGCTEPDCEGSTPGDLLADFPWERLEALRTDLSGE